MGNVARQATALTKRTRDLAANTFDFGLACTILGQHEERSVSGVLVKLGHTSDQLSQLLHEVTDREAAMFEEPVQDYIRQLNSVHAALDCRASARRQHVRSLAEHSLRTAQHSRLEGQPAEGRAAARLESAAAAVDEASAAKRTAAEKLETVSTRVEAEVGRFSEQRAQEMRTLAIDYVRRQAAYANQIEQFWAGLLPELEDMNVGAVDGLDSPLGATIPPPAPAEDGPGGGA